MMVYYSSISQFNTGITAREDYLKILHIPEEEPHVLLKTCNRIEIYRGTGDIPVEIVRHLFRVVAGLESGLTGESAIQGQVKLAYETAKTNYKLSPALHRLFQQALRVGKLVRTQSGIGKGAVSHGQATVEMIASIGIELDKARITLIGVNKLTEDTIRFLQQRGAETLFVANRSYHKALPYAEKYNCKIFQFENLTEVLMRTDVLITATSAPYTVVRTDKFPKNKPMHIFDLAFPRDVDAAIADYAGISLYNIEDIEARIRKNLRKRTKEITIAENIIAQEVISFYKRKHHVGNIESHQQK
jgi:glutamyl-tRNA reductase